MIRQRTNQIAAELEHGPHLALENGLAASVQLVLFPAAVETIEFLEFVDGDRLRFFGDADGALALNIGVAANRSMPAPGLPILPRINSRLTRICTLSTPLTCCVRPMP